uniref:Uncharacterized protein n=1 Tax=Oryza barthii TaxID=65489 RepID=A0A0D3HJM4_9ORYZ
MPLANGDSSADTTTRRNAEDFLAILLKVVLSPEVAGIDASGLQYACASRAAVVFSTPVHRERRWSSVPGCSLELDCGMARSGGNGKDSPAVVDNAGFTATARLSGGMLREGAWVVSEVPKELHARLISPWLTGERGIGDGTWRPELDKMTAISLVYARFLKFL